MKRLALMATAVILGTAGIAQAETITEEVIVDVPSVTPLEAFDIMDLDNNWIVDTIEYDFAVKTNRTAEFSAYSFDNMDINGNGLITRKEAKNLTPEQAAASRTVVRTVVKDPVYVDVYEPAAGPRGNTVVETQTGTNTTVTTEETVIMKKNAAPHAHDAAVDTHKKMYNR